MAEETDTVQRPVVHLDTERDAELIAYLNDLKSTQFRRDVAAALATQGLLTVDTSRIPQPVPDGRKKVLRLRLYAQHAALSDFIIECPRSFRAVLIGRAMAEGYRRVRDADLQADARDQGARPTQKRRLKPSDTEPSSEAPHAPPAATGQSDLPLAEPTDGGELDAHAVHREQRPPHLRLLDDLG